jgi:CheY-like chemotaxis protein
VVEDEDPLREVACRVLTRHGYEVLSASNGPDALELAASVERIDLLLSDVIMPQMLGKELATRLTEVRPDLRVVYMSGYAQPVLASSSGLEPGVRLIEKPFTAEALLAKVRAALDGDDDGSEETEGSA